LATARSTHTTLAFAAVTTLFFAWGFITSLVDPLVAAVKGIFTLTNLQAQASAFAFFFAYFVVSLPAAALVSRLKAVPSILLALCTMAVACLIMLTAANLANYWLVLLGLFVLASGITVLQVAANPLAAALGDPQRSHFRLVLSQTFNSFGTFLGPLLGAHLFLKGVEVKSGAVVDPAVRAEALAGIDTAYLWICGLILALAVFFFRARIHQAIFQHKGRDSARLQPARHIGAFLLHCQMHKTAARRNDDGRAVGLAAFGQIRCQRRLRDVANARLFVGIDERNLFLFGVLRTGRDAGI